MWFTETPWPPVIIFSVFGALLFILWSTRQRGVYLLGILFLALAAGIVVFVERAIVTEAERVEAALYELTATVQRESKSKPKDAALLKTLAFISTKAPGLRRSRSLRDEVSRAIGRVEIEDDVRITDVQVVMKAENSRAVTHFRANGTVSFRRVGTHGHWTSRWRLTWQREAGEWKVIKVERLHPFSGEKMKVLTPRET